MAELNPATKALVESIYKHLFAGMPPAPVFGGLPIYDLCDAALAASRAEGFRRGQEQMRERAASIAAARHNPISDFYGASDCGERIPHLAILDETPATNGLIQP